jgi:hypothetical protein
LLLTALLILYEIYAVVNPRAVRRKRIRIFAIKKIEKASVASGKLLRRVGVGFRLKGLLDVRYTRRKDPYARILLLLTALEVEAFRADLFNY